MFHRAGTEGSLLRHQRTTPVVGSSGTLLHTGERSVEFALDRPLHFTVVFDNSLLD